MLARFSVVTVAVVLAAAGLDATPAHAAPTTFQAATARVEITPTALGFPDYFPAGYGTDEPDHVTGGSPLFATGLLMVNSAGQRWVAVSAEVLAFPTSVTAAIQAAASSQFAIPPQQLLLTGTHTHSGPVIGDQPNLSITYNITPGSAADTLVHSYTNAFQARILDLLSALVAAPTTEVTGSFGYGVGNVGFNRASARPSAVDGNIPVLTLRSVANSQIVAVWFSASAHAVSLGPITTWNGDFPGATVASVESQLSSANPGVRALYFPGADGDQNPLPGLTPAAIAAQLTPQVLAAAAANAGTGAAGVQEPTVAGLQDVSLPLDIRVSDAALRAHYTAVLAGLPSFADATHARLMINQIDSGTLRRAMTVRITGWRFAAATGVKPLVILALAGEPVVDYSIGFGRILSDQYRPWTVGKTDGHPGYLPSDELLARGDGCPNFGCFYGDYEAGWAVVDGGQRYPMSSSITFNDGLVAPLAPGADNLICSAATAIVLGAAADCSGFTPGRVIPHPALSTTGPALANWTDAAGRTHLEYLVLGTDACLHHRTWTGSAEGGGTGTWSGWDPAPICGGIVGPSSADAWVDSTGNAYIEVAVRTVDGSMYHGRCAGDGSGCFGRTWTWTQIATAADGFVEPPELSVWKQQDGLLRIDAFAAQGPSRCVAHRGFTATSQNGSGSWSAAWSPEPGCGGIVGVVAAASWRSGTTVRHDVFVRTSNGSLFGVRCTGTDSSCTWGAWFALSGPSGATVVDAPSYSTTEIASGQRFDLYVKTGDGCVWQGGWTTTAIPAAPGWRKLSGCGLASRVAVTDWRDSFGRGRTSIAALDGAAGGPLWIRNATSTVGTPAGDIWPNWEDVADPTAAISSP